MSPSASAQRIALALILLVVLSLGVGIWQASSQARLAESNIATTPARPNRSGRSGSLLQRALGDRLVTIKLRGMITSESEQNAIFDSDSAAIQARKALDEAAQDKTVKGVLLIIDSPGGTVAMSQELNAAVRRVSAEKPIVASLGDVAASGGYYTAVAADKIVANPGTLTASIGVIIHNMNAQKLLNDKLGVQAVTIKSGKFKDILSPYRPATAEEMALLQGVVDDSYRDFIAAVLRGRLREIKDPATRAQREASIRAVADGRVVLGGEALKVGLVDEIGDGYHAEKLLQVMARKRFGLAADSDLDMQDYSRAKDFFSLIGMQSAAVMARAVGPMARPLEQQVLPFSATHPNQPLWVME